MDKEVTKLLKSKSKSIANQKITMRQKQLFLALCSESDKRKIEGEEEMQLEDYIRILSLLHYLELEKYALAFVLEYPKFLVEYGNIIEMEIAMSMSDEERDKIEASEEIWLIDFWKQIPSRQLRKMLSIYT